MPLEKKGKYGWGAHKDKPFRVGRVEQHVAALRQWLQAELMGFEVKVVNPMHDGWIDRLLEHLRREMASGRDESNLPPKLKDEVVEAMLKHADTRNSEELETIKYVKKGGSADQRSDAEDDVVVVHTERVQDRDESFRVAEVDDIRSELAEDSA